MLWETRADNGEGSRRCTIKRKAKPLRRKSQATGPPGSESGACKRVGSAGTWEIQRSPFGKDGGQPNKPWHERVLLDAVDERRRAAKR
jgi:hypothetical protein